jgi:predicted nucleic acid-binding Zn ribbon protein
MKKEEEMKYYCINCNSMLDGSKRKYCNTDCLHEHQRKERVKKVKEKVVTVKKVYYYYCLHCNKPLLGKSRKYCNNNLVCRTNHLTTIKDYFCTVCGKKLEGRKRKFCSAKCSKAIHKTSAKPKPMDDIIKLINEIDVYLYRLKVNKYTTTLIDIYRLIDLHERSFGLKETNPKAKIEKVIMDMIIDIAKYRNKKMKELDYTISRGTKI